MDARMDIEIVSTADGELVFKYSYVEENGGTVQFDATVFLAAGEIPKPAGVATCTLLPGCSSVCRSRR